MRVLLIGGSKSGKSMLAQELCRRLSEERIYWATMIPTDGEDRDRIKRHLTERDGWGFSTVECGRDLQKQAVPPTAAVLFDSVTALLANEMFGAEFCPEAAGKAAEELLDLSRRCGHFVCVCDDLWRDGRVFDRWTEDYCRGLAEICRALAAEFDVVCEVVAGIPSCKKGELP